jgi:hydroxyquinol 1,2-dioxygenase
MRHIDEDTITQAVIAGHAAARDARLREVTTSLVQHLHAFAREVKLTRAEWEAVLRALNDCSVRPRHLTTEMGLLSDALGVTTLVGALLRRGAQEGTTEAAATVAIASHYSDPISYAHPEIQETPPFYVVGRVCSHSGQALADARVHAWPAPSPPHAYDERSTRTAADGSFHCRFISAPQDYRVADDGMAGRLLTALGRPLWRPAHVYVAIAAPGYRPLVTHLFCQDGKYLDSDALFAVRPSLVVPWIGHAPSERSPDGQHGRLGFVTVDYTFVLEEAAAEATPAADAHFVPDEHATGAAWMPR